MMNTVISLGNHILVQPHAVGFARKPYKATIIEWTPRGKLRVKADGNGKVAIVSSEDAKKVADKRVTES